MTDPQLQRLLAALARDPGDDLLWLAAADCLEESGEGARAELLRLHRRLRGMGDGRPRLIAEGRVRKMLESGVRPCVPQTTSSLGMTFSLIPAGEFWMGSPPEERGRYDEEVRHRVTLTRPFWLGTFPVTQGQYQSVVGSNPSQFSPSGAGKDKVAGLDHLALPVELVTWTDAAAFCEKLAELPDEKAAGHLYRLPTEAEWEYACRGGLETGRFHYGGRLLTRHCNYLTSRLGRTTPAGVYPPNAWGLFDMHGNLWEWCSDWHVPLSAGPATDPAFPEQGDDERRIIRGGSWGGCADIARSAYRNHYAPDARHQCIGFRVILVPPDAG